VVFEKRAVGQLMQIEVEESDFCPQVLDLKAIFQSGTVDHLFTNCIEIGGITYAVGFSGVEKLVGIAITFTEEKLKLGSCEVQRAMDDAL
jgi:hypothetical protein